MTQTKDTASPRRRPSDRKTQILDAVGELLTESSYYEVSMESIAAAVGLTPGALYRHYRSKSELVYAAIQYSLNRWDSEPISGDSTEATLRTGALAAVRHRHHIGLIVREARNLQPEHAQQVQARVDGINSYYSALLERERPDLSVDQAKFHGWAVQSVLSSPGFHEHRLPTELLVDTLVQAAKRVFWAKISAYPESASPAPSRVPESSSRRETIMLAALESFRVHGYEKAGMTAIGRAVNVSGPSLYGYFDSKQSLYDEIMDRASHSAWLLLHEAQRRHRDPQLVLETALESYVRVTQTMPGYASLIVTEQHVINPHAKHRYADYTSELIALLMAADPDRSANEALIVIEAVLAMIHNMGRKDFLARRLGFDDALMQLCRALVRADPQG